MLKTNGFVCTALIVNVVQEVTASQECVVNEQI